MVVNLTVINNFFKERKICLNLNDFSWMEAIEKSKPNGSFGYYYVVQIILQSKENNIVSYHHTLKEAEEKLEEFQEEITQTMLEYHKLTKGLL